MVLLHTSIPDHFYYYSEPQIAHFKLARKRIAEFAREINLEPSHSEVEEIKEKINTLRKKIVYEIDTLISNYDFKKTIPFLLTQIDSLIHTFEKKHLQIEYSLEHQVDYSIQEKYAKEQYQFIRLHKNHRYLIEKFVQLSSQNNKILELNQLQYLIALIDWLHILYSASDSIHYGVFPVGVNITDDYLAEIIYKEDNEALKDLFLKEQAELDLGLIGNPLDRIESPRPIEDFLNELDEAFKLDLQFSLKNMINVLQVLSLWSVYNEDIEENTFYFAGIDEITEICKKSIFEFDINDIEPILDFLTLKSKDVIRVLGQDTSCDDLPVWEHNKRYSRYTLRPLILIDNKYYWGPYSAMKTGVLWTNSLIQTMLPFDLQGANIFEVINSEKRLIARARYMALACRSSS